METSSITSVAESCDDPAHTSPTDAPKHTANDAMAKAFRREMQLRRAKRDDWLVRDSYLAAAHSKAVSNGDVATATACVCSFPRVEIHQGARKLRVRLPDPDAAALAQWRVAKGVRRGKCQGFTSASRKRLFDKMATILRDAALPVFVTLTLPREVDTEPQAAKRHLRALWKRWARRWPSISAIWKMEPQEDGATHFHLIVWGLQFLPWQQVAVEWAEVVTGRTLPRPFPVMPGKTGAALFRAWLDRTKRQDGTLELAAKTASAGTRVEAIRSWGGVMSYCAKYIGKPVETEHERAGRWWGMLGRVHAPVAAAHVEIVTAETAFRVIRALRRAMRKRQGWQPFIERTMCIYTEKPEAVWRIIE